MRMRLMTQLAVAVMAFLGFLSVADLAQAEEPVCHHALSLVGEPKYGADFKNFDWVNPDAPKGGTLRQWADGDIRHAEPVFQTRASRPSASA